MYFSRTRVVPLVGALGTGMLLGLAGPLAAKGDNPVCVVLSLVFSGGWSWACYAFLVGYFRRSKVESALLSSLGLATGVVIYYLLKAVNPAVPAGLEAGATGEGLTSRILVWGAAAFVLGAPVGLLGNIARVPGVGGLPFRLVVPLVAFYETSMRLTAEADRQGPVVGATWSAIRFLAGAVALALVAHTMWTWWHARRLRDPGTRHASW